MNESSPQLHLPGETIRRAAEIVTAPTNEQLWSAVCISLRDVPALTELYRRWRGPLVLLAQRCGVAPEPAEEVLNTAFVKLLRRRERYAAMPRAFAYLRRCVERSCWRVWRAERRRSERERADDGAQLASTAAATAADTLERTELETAVGLALDQLSERERQAVIHRYLMGWTICQTAQVMGVKPTSVATYLERGRQKLGTLLARWAPTPEISAGIAWVAVRSQRFGSGREWPRTIDCHRPRNPRADPIRRQFA
jgi:RNA polymerase sigma-70 factor, ECF subfamily